MFNSVTITFNSVTITTSCCLQGFFCRFLWGGFLGVFGGGFGVSFCSFVFCGVFLLLFGWCFSFLSYPIELENLCVHQMGLLLFLEVV